MKSKPWFALGILAVCAVIVAFAYTTRRPLCMDSKLVERFDRISSLRTTSMFRCGLYRHVEFDPLLLKDAQEFGPRLQRLEVFFETLGRPLDKAVFTIFESEDNRFQILGRQVFISENLLQQKGVIEKALLKMWYRERIQKDQIDFQLLEETVTDLLMHAFEGQQASFLSRWPRALVTFKEYCSGPWRYLEHSQLCEGPESLQTTDLNDRLALPSLRALLSQTLIATYDLLSLEQQLLMLRNLGTNLGWTQTVDLLKESKIKTSELEQDFPLATEVVIKWSDLVLQLLPFDGQLPQAKNLLKTQLERRGFTESFENTRFDWVFRLPAYNEVLHEELYELAIENPDLNIAAIEEDKIWTLPNQQAMSVAVMGPLRTFKTVEIRCGWPTDKQVQDVARFSQYLVVIDDCSVNLKMNLRSLILKGVKSFAVANPKLRFVSFHLPSYQLAVKRGINPINYLRDPEWQRTARFDHESSALQPLAAISAIDWFRP